MSAEIVKTDQAKTYSTAIVELAQTLGLSEAGLIAVMTKHVFHGEQATKEDMLAAAIICREYRLNPILKHIHAIPTSKGKILIDVGIDGWVRIMNDHPAFDGVSFEAIEGPNGPISCTCVIHRKDRANPVIVTEYMEECKGQSEPWRRWPRRMLRHKALKQCVRIAFGVGGVIDQEEFFEEPEDDIKPPKRKKTASRVVDAIETYLPPPPTTDDGEIIETGVRGDLIAEGQA